MQEIANAALADLTGEFATLYPARPGRPSIAPARLLRAMLLQAFYGIRSERQSQLIDGPKSRGQVSMINAAAERALRCIAAGRNNRTFATSEAGGRRAPPSTR